MKQPRSAGDAPATGQSAGFTLLEVLLALFLVSVLLAAISALIVSLFLMWDNTRSADAESRLFSVAGWLERRLELNPHRDTENGWQMNWPDDERTGDPPSLSWISDTREMVIPPEISGGTWEYRLHHDPRQGLFIAWRPTNRTDDTDYSYSLLAADVTALRFAYYDAESDRWQVFDRAPDPERVDNQLPQLAALDFEVGRDTRTIWIVLPQ